MNFAAISMALPVLAAALTAIPPDLPDPPLASQLPASAELHTLAGTADITDWTGARPMALAPIYFTCPTVCGLTEQQVVRAFDAAGLAAGEDAELVFLSFDPRDGDAEAAAVRDRLDHAVAGASDPQIRIAWGGQAGALLDALGYRRRFDPRSEEFAHPAALAILTPDGQVARWLGPEGITGDQLRRALVEASQGRIGSPLERALLACWRFDPQTGTYTPRILLLLQIACLISLAVLGGFVFTHLRTRR